MVLQTWVFPDKTQTLRSVQSLVNPNQNVSNNTKLLQDSALKTHVCNSMAKGVGSSYNSPDAKKQVNVAQEGEVDEEPGGNVAASRRSPRFRHTDA